MAIHIDYTLDIDQLPVECIEDCSAIGDVSESVAYWREKLGFTVDRDRAITCLEGYGAWDREDMEQESDGWIAERILWIACGNFSDQRKWEKDNPNKPPEDSSYGTSCFCLE